MTSVIRFPPPLRSAEGRRPSSSEVVLFPFSRRRALVEHHARAVRSMSSTAMEVYLSVVLGRLCDELRKLGIDCPDCENAAIDEFAEAIGKELYGRDFTLTLEEAVQ
jgi:hypothetical protein